MNKQQKKNLKLAFEELKDLGYFAKQNFACCQSCGWAAMSNEEAQKAVFYHGQDKDDLVSKGYCYLAWSGVGEEIVSVFNKHDIKTEWDGTTNNRIKIEI